MADFWSNEAAVERREFLAQQRAREEAAKRAEQREAEEKFRAEQARLNRAR